MRIARLLQEDLHSLLKEIVKIFDNTIEDYSFEYDIRDEFSSTGVTIKFWRIDKNYCEQTCHLELKGKEGSFDLHLWNMYVPESIKNQGFLTACLKKIRKLPGMSGKCRVHVAANPAWKKIIARSGFEPLNEEFILEGKSDYEITNNFGIVRAAWVSPKRLKGEEGDDDYIPKGCTKILELQMLQASKLGKGYGEKLMNEFLDSPIAKSAHLIFLDPNPRIGEFEHNKEPDDAQIEKLKRFYSKFEFRNNPASNRMWRVQKGKIPTDELPT